MRRVRGLFARVRDIVFRHSADSARAEEFRFHIDMETEKYIAEGVDPREARRRAIHAFGARDRYAEELRERGRVPVIETAWEDLRFGFRQLLRTPVLSTVAVLAIALGVGATTAVVSVVNKLLYRPLPLLESERLVSVQESRSGAVSTGIEGMLIPYSRYAAYREAATTVFESLAAHRLDNSLSLRLGDATISVSAALTSGNYFQTLDVQPVPGRAYSSDDALEIVISHDLWMSRFNGDPAALGQVVGLDGRDVIIVGVAPRRFGGTTVVASEVWAPIGLLGVADDSWAKRVVPLGRLRPDASIARASVIIDAIARRIPPGEEATIRSARLEGLTRVPLNGRTTVSGFFGMLLGSALLVLLIASANIAGVMIARGFARRRELAVRIALGAHRWRIVRHLLTETMLLFAAGGLLGVGLAWYCTRWLARIDLPPQVPPVLLDFALDTRVLIIALIVTGTTGLVFGLIPALHASRPDLVPALKIGSAASTGGSGRVRNVFVGGQVALAVTLLLTATLFVRSLQAGLRTDIGFNPDAIVTATINLGAPFDYDRERAYAFHQALREHVLALPGVERVALAQYVLLSGTRSGGGYRADDALPETSVNAAYNSVTPDYFGTVDMPIIAGRGFTDSDATGTAPVVIINRVLADRLWPDQNPIGRLLIGPVGSGPAEVVGVTGTGAYVFLTDEPSAYVFYPYNQVYRSEMAIHVRAPGREAETLRALADEVRRLDPDLALAMPVRMGELTDMALIPHRWAAGVVGVFGAVGMVLAALGIYGVLAFEVARRTREFGVRRALGATGGAVIRTVVGRAAALVCVGCVVGIALGAGMAIAVRSLLFGIEPIDPVTFVSVPLVLLGVALVASWLPAVRASGVEPLVALRVE